MWSRLRRKGRVWLNGWTGHSQPKEALGHEAQRFWNDFSSPLRPQEAHWRGHGPFADDAVWMQLGRQHVELLQQTLAAHGEPLVHRRVVEWGCGGGMNAVHFARGAETYHGVDIAQPTLDECARQLTREGLGGFVPVLVDGDRPHDALGRITAPCDLFVCTYVIELLPTEAHALELLDIARDLLAPGGHALIHIRCSDGAIASRSRPWDYAANMAHNVTFGIARFRAECELREFTVLDVIEKPAVPELNERDYAYFVLRR